MKNEKGITLVELLATIVIAFFAMGIIYSLVMLAINYFNAETTKTRLQQEANYIITELQRTHRQCETYELEITNEKVEVKNCVIPEPGDGDRFNKVISNTYSYSPDIQTIVYPKRSNLSLNNFKVKDTENDDLEVIISTVISRYQES